MESLTSLDERVLSVIEKLAGELSQQSRRISLESRLEEIGIDSLSRIELLLRIEREFGLSLPERVAVEASTARDIAAALQNASPVTKTASAPASRSETREPAEAKTLLDALQWHAENYDNPHLIYLAEGEERPLSYRELLDGARRIAGGLPHTEWSTEIRSV